MSKLINVLLALNYTFLTSLLVPALTFGQCQVELAHSNGSSGDGFGNSVDISGDWAVVGSKLDDDLGLQAGAAYLYQYNSATLTWEERQKIRASDGTPSSMFGSDVNIDGQLLVVGAPAALNSEGLQSGVAYVFRYHPERTINDRWVQEAKFEQSTDFVTDDAFGSSVSISGDVIAIGAYNDNDRGSFSGSVSIFRYNGTSWAFDQKLTASDGGGSDFFGFSLEISNDFVAIGAYGDDDLGTNAGAVYVFRYVSSRPIGDRWVQERKLTVSEGANQDFFGYSVAATGNMIVASAYGDDDRGPSFGSAVVLRYNGSNWIQEAKLYGLSSASGENFGATNFQSDGGGAISAYSSPSAEIVAVGAPKYPAGSAVGTVYVFRKIGSSWYQDKQLSAINPGSARKFGISVAVDGDRVIAGESTTINKPNVFTLSCLACNSDADCVTVNDCVQNTCSNGYCLHPDKANGVTCDDWNPSTPFDQCLNGACTGAPIIKSSIPPNGFLDALEDKDPSSGTMLGTNNISLTFSSAVQATSGSALSPSNFEVRCLKDGLVTDLQSNVVPTVNQVTLTNATTHTYQVQLSQRICLGAWSEITAVNVTDTNGIPGTSISPAGNRVFLGSLPMDITQDGKVLGDDINRWLAIKNGSFPLVPPLTSFMFLDQKRNGIIAGEDITRGIQLINGIGTFRAWSGFDMGVKP